MNSVVDALYELKYNPFLYSEYIASFYISMAETENNLFFAPLIIPLCSHKYFGEKILNSNVKSSIWSVFKDRDLLYDVQERVDHFQELTDQCLQYSLMNDWLLINTRNLMVQVNDRSFVVQKKANKLGKLFSNYSIVEVYAFFGVKI